MFWKPQPLELVQKYCSSFVWQCTPPFVSLCVPSWLLSLELKKGKMRNAPPISMAKLLRKYKGLGFPLGGPDRSRHSSDQHPKDVNSETFSTFRAQSARETPVIESQKCQKKMKLKKKTLPNHFPKPSSQYCIKYRINPTDCFTKRFV